MHRLLIVCICAFAIALTVYTCNLRKSGSKYVLSGKEVLLEIECLENPAKSGIYTFNPFKENKPQLWLAGAHRPVWSRNRTVLAYEYNDFIYVQKVHENNGIIVASLNYTSRNYNYPLLIMNENQGIIYPQTTSPEIKSDMVCLWREIYHIKPSRQDTSIQNTRSLWPFRPLPQFPRTAISDKLNKRSMPKIGRSVSFAPGEHQAAVAESPLSPFGSQNNYTKIRIYTLGKIGYVYKQGVIGAEDIHYEKLKNRKLLGLFPPLVVEGENCKRLTKLPDIVVEMEPIWSPDGKWIAFTTYDPRNRRSDVMVCKPDGSDIVILTKYVSSSGPYSPFGLKWFSAEKPDFENTSNIPYSDLGINDARALEWSQDSKSLLIARGFNIDAYAVARLTSSHWDISRWIREHELGTQYRSSYRRICFGPANISGTWISYFEQRDNGSQNIVVYNMTGDGSGKSCFVDQDMRVLWMDW